MDNQHKLIKGYRDLTKEEIDKMNEFKASEAVILAQLDDFIAGGMNGNPPMNPRSLALARTKFQEAFMWLIRAVARPNGE